MNNFKRTLDDSKYCEWKNVHFIQCNTHPKIQSPYKGLDNKIIKFSQYSLHTLLLSKGDPNLVFLHMYVCYIK